MRKNNSCSKYIIGIVIGVALFALSFLRSSIPEDFYDRRILTSVMTLLGCGGFYLTIRNIYAVAIISQDKKEENKYSNSHNLITKELDEESFLIYLANAKQSFDIYFISNNQAIKIQLVINKKDKNLPAYYKIGTNTYTDSVKFWNHIVSEFSFNGIIKAVKHNNEKLLENINSISRSL